MANQLDTLVEWWALQDSNLRPSPCKGAALPLRQAPEPPTAIHYAGESTGGKGENPLSGAVAKRRWSAPVVIWTV